MTGQQNGLPARFCVDGTGTPYVNAYDGEFRGGFDANAQFVFI